MLKRDMPYIRMVAGLVEEGMSESKAITLVATTYGLDWHILSVLYRHRDELDA